MSQVDFEKFKSRFEQAKESLIQLISSLTLDSAENYQLTQWKSLLEANHLGLEEDYEQTSIGLWTKSHFGKIRLGSNARPRR